MREVDAARRRREANVTTLSDLEAQPEMQSAIKVTGGHETEEVHGADMENKAGAMHHESALPASS